GARADAEEGVGPRQSQLAEEDVRHLGVVMLARVDEEHLRVEAPEGVDHGGRLHEIRARADDEAHGGGHAAMVTTGVSDSVKSPQPDFSQVAVVSVTTATRLKPGCALFWAADLAVTTATRLKPGCALFWAADLAVTTATRL